MIIKSLKPTLETRQKMIRRDLDRCAAGPRYAVPKGLTRDELREWFRNVFKKDDKE
jgi:hypothetical protein